MTFLDSRKSDDLEMFSIAFYFAFLLIGIFSIIVGRYLKYQKTWSKASSCVVVAFDLLMFPIGTVFGIAIIFYLYKGWNDEPFKI